MFVSNVKGSGVDGLCFYYLLLLVVVMKTPGGGSDEIFGDDCDDGTINARKKKN